MATESCFLTQSSLHNSLMEITPTHPRGSTISTCCRIHTCVASAAAFDSSNPDFQAATPSTLSPDLADSAAPAAALPRAEQPSPATRGATSRDTAAWTIVTAAETFWASGKGNLKDLVYLSGSKSQV